MQINMRKARRHRNSRVFKKNKYKMIYKLDYDHFCCQNEQKKKKKISSLRVDTETDALTSTKQLFLSYMKWSVNFIAIEIEIRNN